MGIWYNGCSSTSIHLYLNIHTDGIFVTSTLFQFGWTLGTPWFDVQKRERKQIRTRKGLIIGDSALSVYQYNTATHTHSVRSMQESCQKERKEIRTRTGPDQR